jgi:hypothetical protein
MTLQVFAVGRDFESVAKLWIRDRKFKFVNIVNTALLCFALVSVENKK